MTPETPDATDVLDTGEAGGLAIRGAVLRTGGYVAGALVTLVSVPLLVRHLGVVDFGRYTTVVSLVAIVAGITEAGLGSVAVREYAALAAAPRRRLMRDILGARVALTGAGVFGAVGFAAAASYDQDMIVGTVLAGAGLVLSVVQNTYVVPLAAGLRLGWVSAGELLRSILMAAFVVALVLAGAGMVPFLAVPIPAALVLVVATVILVRRDVPLIPAFHPSRWWRVLRETLPLAAATAVGTLYFRMAIILMSLIAAAVQTGYFATSYRFIEALAGIPLTLVGVTFPILARAARDDPERLRYAVQRIFEIALMGGVWMALATALGAGFAMQVIGGHAAAPAAGVLRVQALYLVPLFLNLTWQTTLLALHMHREMLISAIVALVAVLALALVLVPRMDAHGAAIAVVAGESVLAAVEGVLLWRARPWLRPDVGIVPRVAVALAAAVAVGLALPVHDVVRVVAASAVYVALLAALRAIPAELVHALLRRPPAPEGPSARL